MKSTNTKSGKKSRVNRSNIALRYLLSFPFVLAILTVGSQAQKDDFRYPLWFLNQGELKCSSCAVGYAAASIYPDSAFKVAYQNALMNYSLSQNVSISGGQAFWSTETGTAWMGNDFTESGDSVEPAALRTMDKYEGKGFVLVLAGAADFKLEDGFRGVISAGEVPPPVWTEKLPTGAEYLYAVGVAPEYFYEVSSWLEAEKSARRNVARSQFVRMKELQKYTRGDDQEMRTEELSLTLRNAQIVARWRDIKKKIFYVLTRSPL